MFFLFIVIIILVFPGMVVKSEPFSIAAGLDYITLCKKILYDIAFCVCMDTFWGFFVCWWNIKTLFFSILFSFLLFTFLLDSGNYILQFGLIWNVQYWLVSAKKCRVPGAGDMYKEMCEGKKSRTLRSNYQNHKLCLLFCESKVAEW